jgi:hypothetical protein
MPGPGTAIRVRARLAKTVKGGDRQGDSAFSLWPGKHLVESEENQRKTGDQQSAEQITIKLGWHTVDIGRSEETLNFQK